MNRYVINLISLSMTTVLLHMTRVCMLCFLSVFLSSLHIDNKLGESFCCDMEMDSRDKAALVGRRPLSWGIPWRERLFVRKYLLLLGS